MNQPQPPLMSLKIHRTVETILNSPQSETSSVSIKPALKPLKEQEPEFDQAGELKLISELVEQQSFTFLSFLNKIRDARKDQADVLSRFNSRAKAIEERIGKLQDSIAFKAEDLAQRLTQVERIIHSKPLFRGLHAVCEEGRVTGICLGKNSVVCTTTHSELVELDRETMEIKHVTRVTPHAALFSPSIFAQNNVEFCFFIAGDGSLYVAAPVGSEAVRINPEDLPVESYRLSPSHSFDLITSTKGELNFWEFTFETSKPLIFLGKSPRLRGAVLSMEVDNEQECVYAITSKRYFYCISVTNYTIVFKKGFAHPLFQLFVTPCFIALAEAPNDIIIAENSRVAFNEINRVEIPRGLRYFSGNQRQLFVVTKAQVIERRLFGDLDNPSFICEASTADYDPNEYMSVITSDRGALYLSHNNKVSVWY